MMTLAQQPVLEGTLSGLDLNYSVQGKYLIKELDCVINGGGTTALLGANGAGKSTLLHLLAGILRPASGRVELDGEDLASVSPRMRAQRIALVEQAVVSEQPLKVLDVVLLGRTPFQRMFAGPSTDDYAAASAALQTVGMAAFGERHFHTLSGGEKQRIHVARALAQQPRVLLLDEPTNHLDIGAQLVTMRLLQGLALKGMTVVAAIHDLNLAAQFCEHAILLDGGSIVAAGPMEIVLTPATILKVFGVEAAILVHPRSGRPLVVFG
ncbi:UNVERIFIED_CONTAM: iron complex transport system ATP-binding protein [Jeotgalibacillus campisalis]